MAAILLACVAAAAPERAVLEGVPRIGYHVHLCPFPGSLHALMQYLEEPVDYDVLMGLTGACFRRIWSRDDGGNVDLSYLTPEPYRRAQRAIGYELTRIEPADREGAVAAVKRSIDDGVPVLAFGIIGPPECGLITGYAENGDVVYGWSYFQDFEPGQPKDRYYEQRGWLDLKAYRGLMVLGERLPEPEPSDKELLVDALRWAVDLERVVERPNLDGYVCGLAAYDAWAAALEVDADYPADDPAVMETRCMVHCDQCAMLHERHDAARFLRRMAERVQDVADDLTAAADLYDQTADQGEGLWRWQNWQERQTQIEFADGDSRRAMVVKIRAAKALEERAVEHLEEALRILEG